MQLTLIASSFINSKNENWKVLKERWSMYFTVFYVGGQVQSLAPHGPLSASKKEKPKSLS